MTVKELKEAHLNVGSTVYNASTRVSIEYAAAEIRQLKDQINKSVINLPPANIMELLNMVNDIADRHILLLSVKSK